MIAGFDRPTAGKVFLHGADVTALPPYERDVNTVFQDYALFPHMSVGDNIAYGLKIRKVDKAERLRRVEEMLELVRLPGYACLLYTSHPWPATFQRRSRLCGS